MSQPDLEAYPIVEIHIGTLEAWELRRIQCHRDAINSMGQGNQYRQSCSYCVSPAPNGGSCIAISDKVIRFILIWLPFKSDTTSRYLRDVGRSGAHPLCRPLKGLPCVRPTISFLVLLSQPTPLRASLGNQ